MEIIQGTPCPCGRGRKQAERGPTAGQWPVSACSPAGTQFSGLSPGAGVPARAELGPWHPGGSGSTRGVQINMQQCPRQEKREPSTP